MEKPLMEKYIDFLRSKGLSEITLKNRRYELGVICRETDHTLESLELLTAEQFEKDLELLMRRLWQAGRSYDTAYRYAYIFKGFLDFCKVDGIKDVDEFVVCRKVFNVKPKQMHNRPTEEEKQELEEFLKDETMQNWWKANEGIKARKKIAAEIWRFCKAVEMTPTELWRERVDSVMKGDKIADHYEAKLTAEGRVLDYLNTVKVEKNLEPATVRKILTFVFNFYRTIGQPLNQIWLKRRIKRVRSEVPPFSKEEIRLMLNYTESTRDKAIILLMSCTGLNAEEVVELTVGDLTSSQRLEPSEFEELEPPKLGIPIDKQVFISKLRGKTGIQIKTFLTPEALEMIKQMLRMRCRGLRDTKHEHGWSLKEKLTNESPLFASFLTSHPGRRALAVRMISYIATKAAKRAGIYDRKKSSHSFRRYFATTLEDDKLGIHPNWIKIMMGHALGAVEEAYSKPSNLKLRDAYVKAIPSLMILEEYAIKTTLEETQKKLEEHINILKSDEELFDRYVLVRERLREKREKQQ